MIEITAINNYLFVTLESGEIYSGFKSSFEFQQQADAVKFDVILHGRLIIDNTIFSSFTNNNVAFASANDFIEFYTGIINLGAVTGASTSANQDLLLAELQAKADLTETQPVSVQNFPASQIISDGGGSITIDNPFLSNQIGTWGYNSGISGTLTLTGTKKVLMITAIGQEASATITINGGDTITLPYGGTDKVSSSIEIKPVGTLVSPTIVFTGTKGYFVEWVS